ncbi:hypothetical protein ACJ73_00031, partial [Blastomyces percursus]
DELTNKCSMKKFSRNLEVLETVEDFGEVDEEIGFRHTIVIYRWNGAVYRGLSKYRYQSKSEVQRSHLTDITLIPPEDYCPIFQPHFTLAPDLFLTKGYIKHPRLSTYQSSCPKQISEQVLTEVEVCEAIRKDPHPNLAQYHGCKVYDGRITGLCFTKYNETLMERVNPKFFSKSSPPSNGLVPLESLKPWLDGIKQGIQHLHSLGWIHNDVNPSNIMFDNDGRPVIIDFDSCRPEGHSLGTTKRTYEWYDEDAHCADPNNDLKALDDLQAWLSGKMG